jgi:2-methylcitrate dehydratase PrpD
MASHTEDEPVTKRLAEFVVRSTEGNVLDKEISTKLKALLLDYLGISCAAIGAEESSAKFLSAIEAFAGSAKGNCTVLTQGSSFMPQYAALLNAALCHTLDFDDTHCAAIVHPGSSVISAALAEAERHQTSGSRLLLSLAVGYEVTCRLGMGLGYGSMSRGFHNTATAGLYGSIATICKLRGCPEQVVNDAFGLAISKAAGSGQFLDNGAWNKRLHPGFAAHDALLCVSLAEAGVIGATKAIEGKYGLLHNYSDTGSTTEITPDLGRTWIFLNTACKPFPACRMTHGILEMVGKMRKLHLYRGTPHKVVVTLPEYCFIPVGQPTLNKVQPRCVVDAQFSAYYQVAASWHYGSETGWLIYKYLDDPKVQELCSRISVETHPTWQRMESGLKVFFDDGTVLEEEVIYPLGEPERPFEWHSGVEEKFLGLAEPVYGKAKARKICSMVDAIDGAESVLELMEQLAHVL